MTSSPMPAPTAAEPVADASHAPKDAGLQPGSLISGAQAVAPGETIIASDNVSKVVRRASRC